MNYENGNEQCGWEDMLLSERWLLYFKMSSDGSDLTPKMESGRTQTGVILEAMRNKKFKSVWNDANVVSVVISPKHRQ